MTDPRNEARHVKAVIRRAMRTQSWQVMPADWRERRALVRMTEQGRAAPVLGLPNVWTMHPHLVRNPS